MEVTAVHKVDFTIGAGLASVQVTIPGDPGATNLWLDGLHYRVNEVDNLDPREGQVSARVSDGVGTIATFQRELLGPQIQGTAYFVERLDSNTVIQHGVTTLANTLTTVTQSITSTTLSESFLVFSTYGGTLPPADADNGGSYRVMGEFDNATTLRFSRKVGGATNGTIVIHWFVVRHADLSVQTAAFDRTTISQIEDITITSVDLATTRVVGSTMTDDDQWTDECGREIFLLDETTVRTQTGFSGDHGSQSDAVTAFVVTDTGVSPWAVQHINEVGTTAASGTNVTTETSAKATLAQTNVPGNVASPQVSDLSRYVQRFARAELASSIQQSWDRQVAGTDTCSFRWNVVDYDPAVTPPDPVVSTQSASNLSLGLGIGSSAGGGGGCPECVTYFFDSVNGNDANDGLTKVNAKKTFDDVPSLGLVAHDILKLVGGSVFDSSTLPGLPDDVWVLKENSGADPIIDCMDAMPNAGFVLIGGGTNAYEDAFTPDEDGASGKSFSVTEDGIPLQWRATPAAVDAEAGTYHAPALNNSTSYTITIHATDSSDVSANGKVYKASSRAVGVAAGDRAIIRGVRVEGPLDDWGAIRAGKTSQIEECQIRHYRGRAAAIESGIFHETVAMYGINGLTEAALNIDGDGTGACTFQFCAVVGHPGFDPTENGRSGFFVQSSGAPYARSVMAFCGQAYLTDASVINCEDALLGFNISYKCVEHWKYVATGILVGGFIRSYSHLAPWRGTSPGFEFTGAGGDCFLDNSVFVGSEGELLEFTGAELQLRNCVFAARNKTGDVTAIRVHNGVSSFDAERILFVDNVEKLDVGYHLDTGVTFTNSDLNVTENSVDWIVGVTTYNSFANYKNGTGMDPNSSTANPTFETELIAEMPTYVQDSGSPTINTGAGLIKQSTTLAAFEAARTEAES